MCLFPLNIPARWVYHRQSAFLARAPKDFGITLCLALHFFHVEHI